MNQPQEPHLGELTDLYAVAALDEIEMRRVEAHVAACERCRGALREAEEAAVGMMEAGELRDAPIALHRRIAASARARAGRPAVPSWAALAAAFVMGAILPASWLYTNERRMQADDAMRGAAIQSLVRSHFLHAPLQPLAADAPKAKAIFPRDGSWIYVVIDSPPQGLQIAGTAKSHTQVLGSPIASGPGSAFYAPLREKIESVLILRDGRPVERASIVSSAAK